jgi:hypothetical protein
MADMPDLDRLRAWADWNDQDPYSTGGHGGIWHKGSGVESWKHLTQRLPTRQPSRRRRVPTDKEAVNG